MPPAIAIFFVLIGCCSNVIFLEFLTRELPGSGNIITFFQFLFIAVHGFVWTMRCGREASKIPIRAYITMVSIFFVVSVLNNYALNFGIPMPLHMIFKGGSLVANILMGMWVLGRYYPRFKYLAVLLITAGIILCTYCSRLVNQTESQSKMNDSGVTSLVGGSRMLVGVAILLVALLMSARLGIFQEVLYRNYGKHSQQALFFTHALPLPAFTLLYTDIVHHAALFSTSPPITLPLLAGISVPKMWLYLGINVITQYLCISSVFRLTETCSSLTVTLVITLRKFVSLLFSIWFFSNPFLSGHWVGSLLVFAGTLMFTDPFGWMQPRDSLKRS